MHDKFTTNTADKGLLLLDVVLCIAIYLTAARALFHPLGLLTRKFIPTLLIMPAFKAASFIPQNSNNMRKQTKSY
jgi:hypothetical protein